MLRLNSTLGDLCRGCIHCQQSIMPRNSVITCSGGLARPEGTVDGGNPDLADKFSNFLLGPVDGGNPDLSDQFYDFLLDSLDKGNPDLAD